jgi:hypothetical protein
MTVAEKGPLHVCQRFFESLNQEHLRYCHWKSNEHLPEALAGETDLDLLVASDQRTRLVRVLDVLDFKRVCSPAEKRYPGLEDYLGFDEESGALVHLHVHYVLILGQRHLKNHHLPLEAAVLDDVRMLGLVRVPSAEMEMLLLVIRANMKLSLFRLLRRWRRPGIHLLPKAIVREFHFLARDWDEERFLSVVRDSGLPLSEPQLRAFISSVLEGSITTLDLYRMRATVFRSLRGFRRLRLSRAALRGLRSQFFRSRLARSLAPRKKTLPGRGPAVALVGADGAGKTALSGDLRVWLSWKLLAPPAYFGIPKRARTYRALRWATARLRSPKLSAEGRPFRARAARLEQRLRAAQWLFVARRRLSEYQRVQRLAARGAVVVADRYPLDVFHSMEEPMDGPRIRRELGDVAARSAAREEALYARIGLPSRVLVLRTGLESLRARKPGLDPVAHGRKVSAVNAIGSSELFAVIDGERCYQEVLLDLKRSVWSLL